MIEKTKIKFKKGVACLLAALQIGVVAGCAQKGISEDDYNKALATIEQLEKEKEALKEELDKGNILEEEYNEALAKIEQLEKEKAALQDSNKKLEETINKGNNDSELNSSSTEEYIQKALESASERSEQIRTSENPNLMIYKTYAYVSDEYKNLEGKRYVWVKVNSNDKYMGLFNLETLNEDIPCNTFDLIKDEFHIYNIEGTYRWVSIPGDDDYTCGLYDTANSNLIIPCKTYTNIKYYEKDGIYQCIKPDGTSDSVQLPFRDDKYKIEDLFTYDRSLDSKATYNKFYGKSFFITARVSNDLDSYIYELIGRKNHTHCIGGDFSENHNKPYYTVRDFFDGIGEDVILFLNDDGTPQSVLTLDAEYQDNYAYNTSSQEYARCLNGLIHNIDPVSSMSLRDYLETNGMQDLIKDEYLTSELIEIQRYVENLNHSKLK